MTLPHWFIIARGRAGRPTLQHVLAQGNRTACGLDVTGWSRHHSNQPIPQVLCTKCRKAIS